MMKAKKDKTIVNLSGEMAL